jgi:hypothetical protein
VPQPVSTKFLTVFEVLDGGNGTNAPVALETWELYGCYLQGVNYNNADYGASEAMTLALTIRFDNANQVSIAGGTANGVGVGVGRLVGDIATSIASPTA